jgi:hypothetical protein
MISFVINNSFLELKKKSNTTRNRRIHQLSIKIPLCTFLLIFIHKSHQTKQNNRICIVTRHLVWILILVIRAIDIKNKNISRITIVDASN